MCNDKIYKFPRGRPLADQMTLLSYLTMDTCPIRISKVCRGSEDRPISIAQREQMKIELEDKGRRIIIYTNVNRVSDSCNPGVVNKFTFYNNFHIPPTLI